MGEQGDRRDGMRVDWDVPVTMDDGLVLRADVFRPQARGRFPVVLSYGPYAKGLPFQVGYATAWQQLAKEHPDALRGSSNQYQSWEVADPEKWVPDGYVCLRVDGRGWGRSPGFVDPFSPRETRDLYGCIEWAGVQPWSSGKVGLLGISYYAINQWHVAGLQPPHLAAMIPWEGFGDFYRDCNYHGGIRSTSQEVWYGRVIASVQHGRGERGPVNPNTGELAMGPETLPDEELAANRIDLIGELQSHPLDGPFYRERSADWPRVVVPFLSSGNWGGHGMHLRGNVEAFVRAASPRKWLEIHGGAHWAEFYTDYGVTLQKRFFAHFLKGVDNGWDRQPPVHLRVRHPDRFVDRDEFEWPLARTRWTRLHLNPALTLDSEPVAEAATVSYEGMGEGVTFVTHPFPEETEITGPVLAHLFVSSSTSDADLFGVIRVFSPNGEEVVFQGAVDPHCPVGQGWLRVSHRKQDPALSTPHQPHHTHDEIQPMTPGEIYEVSVEVWPTCIVLPAGYRLALSVQGRDYESPGAPTRLSHFAGSDLRGSGIYLHNDPHDRPPGIYGGRITLHLGGPHDAYLQVPIVPGPGQ